MSTAAPFRPRSVPAAEAAFTNAALGKRRRLSLDLGGGAWEVRLVSPGARRPGTSLKLSDGAAQAWVHLTDWNGIPQIADLTGGAFDALPAEMQAVVAEVALAPALDALGNATGTAWRIEEFGPPPGVVAHRLGFELQDSNGGLRRGELALDGAASEALTALLHRTPPAPHRDLGDVPLPVRLLVGETRLGKGDVAGLRAGDVVLIERPFGRGEEGEQPGTSALALVGSGLAFAATIDQTTAVFRAPASLPAAPGDDVVRFEIAGAPLAFKAAQRLKPNAALPLAGGTQDVRLTQAGRVFASGALVLCAGQLAVRLRAEADLGGCS